MSVETIERGKWIFLERSLPGYFIYRLLEGKVSIFNSGTKINEIEVKRGDKPVLIGMISTLRPDGMHIASVRSESQIKVEKIYSDQVRGIINNEIPESTKANVKTMIETVIVRNEIEGLKTKLKSLSDVKLDIPASAEGEVREVLESLKMLYSAPEKQ